MSDELKIEKVFSDNHFDTVMITGLTVDEMNFILDPHSKCPQRHLQEVMNAHNGNLGDIWRYKNGIHSIRHVGGHLLVQIGNNCD